MGKNDKPQTATLTQTQTDACLKITREIFDLPIATYFRAPVNTAEFPNYKVKKPMDLGTVIQRLDEQKYKNVDQWRNDMKLIWDNAKDFNSPDSIVHSVALELKQYFERKSDRIPKNEMEAWQFELQACHGKIQEIMALRPTPRPKLVLRRNSTNIGE
ncbi:Bromodomain containing protein [Trichomonas vaginalis G3]|uniref:Bromodomain containing protein n=1 Tax=Trichomonas vaginalis (strain ATCC PRA-98 / G3) TaxID=412133 RepID=A2F6Y8_TRIV3|nr:acetylation-dependent protein binding [Trichomonas vaginalis G3]EAX99349.1 Bromodomain containing protein [Trichomonas vaginalis G3]KAI5538963.1 acetylation-dependent protein binding [Trichomonas vaginalis G3]|eukprot:XP_001312279.1 Bromodomain containing protein [Trichomonas vaginalis G3]